jgi:DNA-directed RNA polymerase specialized sigma24 family protein
VEAADETGRLRDILEAVRAHRLADDFSDRWSYAKEDFERKLNHKRSKVKVIFAELPDTTTVHGPETEVIGNAAVTDFMTLLNPRQREIVVLLQNGTTKLTDIADIMGYASHGAVSKRLSKIRDIAAQFFDAD